MNFFPPIAITLVDGANIPDTHTFLISLPNYSSNSPCPSRLLHLFVLFFFFFKHFCCRCTYNCSKISKLPSNRLPELRIYTSCCFRRQFGLDKRVRMLMCVCVRHPHEGTKEAISCLPHQSVSYISGTTGIKVFASFCFPLAICKTNIG